MPSGGFVKSSFMKFSSPVEPEIILKTITSSVRDAIIMIDNQGNIIFWNEASTRIFGYSRDEVHGKNLHMLLIPERYKPQHRKAFPEFQKTGEGSAVGQTLELSAVRKGGEEFLIELSLTAVNVSGEWRAIGIIRDITQRKKAEQLLAENEEKYRKIFESVQDVYYQVDLEGNIVEISPSVERYSSYSREELIGTPISNFYADPEQRKNLLRQMQEQGEVIDYEVLLVSKDNRKIWTSVNAHFHRDKKGKVIGIEGSLRDINNRKEAEELIKREQILLRTLIDNLPDAIYVKDLEGRKVVANRTDLELMGFDHEEEVIGKTDLELFPGGTGVQGYEEDQQILQQQKATLNFESEFTDNRGIRHWHRTTKVPLKDEEGNLMGLVGIGRDIAERKRYIQKLEQQAEALQELNATKDKFFSIIAHDLKNPFNAIIGISDLLIEDMEEMTRPEIMEMLQAIENSSRRAYALLENLLIWSQSQTGRLSFVPVRYDLQESIRKTIDLVEGQAAKKKITLAFDPGQSVMVSADQYMIETVIRNLLTNAIKFTPQGGIVSVLAREVDGEVEVSVRDTGVGIPPEKLPQIFSKESKTKTPGTDNESGTGLGLILCKDFVERHGGTIRVESQVGKGSTFRFTIPEER